MATIDGNALMFTSTDVQRANDVNTKLMRLIFVKEAITNQGYLERYWQHFRDVDGIDRPKIQQSQCAASDRKFLTSYRGISHRHCKRILAKLGYIVQQEAFSDTNAFVELLDTRTGDIRKYSSDDPL